MKKYKDYHDYVIKDGKLIGEFEKMYQESTDVPWHQDKTSFDWYADVNIQMLNPIFGNIEETIQNVIDLACGLGYFTRRVSDIYSIDNMVGLDISKTAIEKCKVLHEESSIEFLTADLASENFSLPYQDYFFDLALMRDLLWYVFPQMNMLLKNIHRILHEGSYLLIQLCFPALHKEFVGKNVFPEPDAILDLFGSNGFKAIYESRLWRHLQADTDGPIEVVIFRKE